MKYVARLIPLLVLFAVIRKSCRMAAAHHGDHQHEDRGLNGGTL